MPRFAAFFAPLLLIASISAGHAQTASALLREGDTLATFGTVNSINNPSVNHVGGYSVQVNTTTGTAFSHIWGNPTGGTGALLRTEGTFAGYEQTAFESFNGFADAGEVCYGVTATEVSSGTTGLDGVFVDATPILVELQPVASMPGQFSTFNSRPGVTGKGDPYWVGGITATQGGATQNRVLFIGPALTPLLKGGDLIGGVGLAQVTSAMDFDCRVSRQGTHYIIEAQVASASTSDMVMTVDDVAVSAGGGFLREGSPVPASIGGLVGENWAAFDNQGVTESGLVFVTGDTSAAVTVDEFVFQGGQIVLREGAVLTIPEGDFTLSGAIEGGYQNRQGDWAVVWDANNPSAVNVEILVVNGALVLKEGDIVDLDGDGTPEATSHLADFTGIASLVLGPRDALGNVTAYFTADVDTLGTPSSTDDTEALLRITVPSGIPNVTPVAACQPVTVPAGVDCDANADVNDGSSDPDDDPITLDQAPAGPYPVGVTNVTLTVTDIRGATDSCETTVTVTAADAPLELSVALDELSWTPDGCNTGYDVVRGDMDLLVSSSGDFSVATLECVVNDHPTTVYPYSAAPGEGQVDWFLVRRASPSGNGTYGSAARDAGVALSGNDCP
jgi:hypothetical protein